MRFLILPILLLLESCFQDVALDIPQDSPQISIAGDFLGDTLQVGPYDIHCLHAQVSPANAKLPAKLSWIIDQDSATADSICILGSSLSHHPQRLYLKACDAQGYCSQDELWVLRNRPPSLTWKNLDSLSLTWTERLSLTPHYSVTDSEGDPLQIQEFLLDSSNHRIDSLTQLKPGSWYHWQIHLRDEFGEVNPSPQQYFYLQNPWDSPYSVGGYATPQSVVNLQDSHGFQVQQIIDSTGHYLFQPFSLQDTLEIWQELQGEESAHHRFVLDSTHGTYWDLRK